MCEEHLDVGRVVQVVEAQQLIVGRQRQSVVTGNGRRSQIVAALHGKGEGHEGSELHVRFVACILVIVELDPLRRNRPRDIWQL
jgi:hypothetical protein